MQAWFEGVLSEALKKAGKVRPRLDVSAKLDTGRPAEKIIQTVKTETSMSSLWEAGG